jgi:hypothetical protein
MRLHMKKKLLWTAFCLGLILAFLEMAGNDSIGTGVTAITGDTMDWHSRWLVGRHGINCGRVPVNGDPTTATECALKAQGEGKPFRVVYNIMGYDAPVAGGVVRATNGELYGLSFDGDPRGGGGVSLLGQRLSTSPCPKPIHLWVNPKGRINCFQQQLSPPSSLMSPNFEPY